MKTTAISTSLLLVIIFFVFQCKSTVQFQYKDAQSQIYTYTGRVHENELGEMELVSSASSVSFGFMGDSICLFLRNEAPAGEYNYVTVVIDDEVFDRFPINGDSITHLGFRIQGDKPHHSIQCVKATEALNGLIVFAGASAPSFWQTDPSSRPQILFIGNSITCGMGGDTAYIPCGSGKWYDQHDAYFAYGPRLARLLNADYVLHSVSGIGMYRQWDVDAPAMPAVYDHLYFDTVSTTVWDDHRTDPQLISIELGTNDLSPGDGIHPRLTFDSVQFVKAYLDFAHHLYRNYPEARFMLLSSPMEYGENAKLLENCLTQIRQTLNLEYPHRYPATVYFFAGITNPGGCGGHPSNSDHARMAKALLPVFQQVLND